MVESRNRLFMSMSPRGRALLAEWEELRLKMYRDSAGLPTIGVGHLLTKDELSSGKIFIRGTWVKYAPGLTTVQAMDLLSQDLARFERAVNEGVRVPLTQNQFDALVAFAFNAGAEAFAASTLLRLLNQGRLEDVPAQLRRWIHSGGEVSDGLKNRREYEVALWGTEDPAFSGTRVV